MILSFYFILMRLKELIVLFFLQTASSTQQDCITFQSQQVNGPASMMQAMSSNASCMLMDPSCNNIGFPFPTGPLSLTTITEESKVTDYQDCGLSPAFLAGESPWESTLETSSPQARDKAKMRYNEKKKTRMYTFFSELCMSKYINELCIFRFKNKKII